MNQHIKQVRPVFKISGKMCQSATKASAAWTTEAIYALIERKYGKQPDYTKDLEAYRKWERNRYDTLTRLWSRTERRAYKIFKNVYGAP